MHATSTNLPADLRTALQQAGLTPSNATVVAHLLPPAGQHNLLTALNTNPNALRGLATAWVGDVADRLRTTYADADIVRFHAALATGQNEATADAAQLTVGIYAAVRA